MEEYLFGSSGSSAELGWGSYACALDQWKPLPNLWQELQAHTIDSIVADLPSPQSVFDKNKAVNLKEFCRLFRF
jgi:hypothetical protein